MEDKHLVTKSELLCYRVFELACAGVRVQSAFFTSVCIRTHMLFQIGIQFSSVKVCRSELEPEFKIRSSDYKIFILSLVLCSSLSSKFLSQILFGTRNGISSHSNFRGAAFPAA